MSPAPRTRTTDAWHAERHRDGGQPAVAGPPRTRGRAVARRASAPTRCRGPGEVEDGGLVQHAVIGAQGGRARERRVEQVGVRLLPHDQRDVVDAASGAGRRPAARTGAGTRRPAGAPCPRARRPRRPSTRRGRPPSSPARPGSRPSRRRRTTPTAASAAAAAARWSRPGRGRTRRAGRWRSSRPRSRARRPTARSARRWPRRRYVTRGAPAPSRLRRCSRLHTSVTPAP